MTTTKTTELHILTPNATDDLIEAGELATLDDNSGRALLWLTKHDRDLFDRLPGGPSNQTATVIDQNTNKVVTLKRSNCGAGCYCAAKIISVTSLNQQVAA
jgi:hypothetical protein